MKLLSTDKDSKSTTRFMPGPAMEPSRNKKLRTECFKGTFSVETSESHCNPKRQS